MKKSLYVVLAFVAIIATSCSTYQYTARQTNIEQKNIITSPTVVDIRVDYAKRINVTSQRCKTQTEAMQEARYLAIVNNNIDVLVDPIYKIERKPAGMRKYVVSLTGFAGYFTNSRTMLEDMKQLKEFSREDIEKYLILHQPEVLKYMNQEGEVVNIYHGCKASGKDASCEHKIVTPATPAQSTKGKK
ncbi:MAG: hypothetical protein MJZ65_06305 [Paludibacteraceae bacterium]|nr:hypothetical protein [Paludibacteraceae bacterium]